MATEFPVFGALRYQSARHVKKRYWVINNYRFDLLSSSSKIDLFLLELHV